MKKSRFERMFLLGLIIVFSCLLSFADTNSGESEEVNDILIRLDGTNGEKVARELDRIRGVLREGLSRELKEELFSGLVDRFETANTIKNRVAYLKAIREFQDKRALKLFEDALESDNEWMVLAAIGGIYVLDKERGMKLYVEFWRENKDTRVGGEAMKMIESELYSIYPELIREIGRADFSGDERIALVDWHLNEGTLYSVENRIRKNLREVYSAASRWSLQTGQSEVTYEELLDEGYLTSPESIAGEDYEDIEKISWRNRPVELTVVTEDGEVVTLRPHGDKK